MAFRLRLPRRTAHSASMAPEAPTFPPRVLLVMPEQWPRALLRAALREAGYDALGAPGLSAAARYRPSVTGRGPVRLVIVDQSALREAESARLDALMRRHPDAAPVLLGRATSSSPPVQRGHPNWRAVIRRPASIEEIVARVGELLPLPPGGGRPLD
jgi:DNA-binding response OmpR family regulator